MRRMTSAEGMAPTGHSGLVVIDAASLEAMIEAAVRRALGERAPVEAPTEWIDAVEAARVLGVHPRTIARLAKSGELPSRRVGRLLRFARSAVEARRAGG